MKWALVLVAVFILLVPAAFAQQDPDDPGIQDSIIVGSAHVDSNETFVLIPVYAVTDDTVMFYNIPIRWNDPQGNIQGGQVVSYFSPLNTWDLTYDTTITNQSYFRIFGVCDLMQDSVNLPLMTNGSRVQIMNLRVNLRQPVIPQLVVFDSTYDDRGGSILLGLGNGRSEITPAFQSGFIGVNVGINESGLPGKFELSQNYPNPFNPETQISFSLEHDGLVTLKIYDILGRDIRTLADQTLAKGRYSLIWDGRDYSGNNAPSGTYFYKLASEGYSDTKKMTLIR
jgi:hypothetical protein